MTKYLTHDADDRTLACPECDRGHRWYVREDGQTRCPDCDTLCDPGDLVDRPDERGEHTPREASALGGRKGGSQHSDAFMRKIAQMGGRPPKWGGE